MSDTPRTDAFEALPDRPINWWDFARELERENAELKKQANDEFDTVITRNMELVRENGRLRMALDASCNAEELRQVRAENAALRKDKERLDSGEIMLLVSDEKMRHVGRHKVDLRAAIDAARKEAQP